mgnify:CR=1 FL=1
MTQQEAEQWANELVNELICYNKIKMGVKNIWAEKIISFLIDEKKDYNRFQNEKLIKKYLLKSRDRSSSIVKMAPEIRKRVTFRKLNLMDRDFRMKDDIHIAFCRNVIIYFNKETQESILNKIIKNLVPQGYLFQGHSESVQGMSLPLKPIHPTIFKKAQ